MLDNQRIREARLNMNIYLEDSLLSRQAFKKIIFDTYLRNHKESLNLAEYVYTNNRSNLWIIVISYYSMFYNANAVIYKFGYKIGTKIAHKVTADTLITLVRDKLKFSLLEDYENIKEEALEIAVIKADDIIDSFDKELTKRSFFQYETTEEIKSSKAKTSFERAKEFSLEMFKLLDE